MHAKPHQPQTSASPGDHQAEACSSSVQHGAFRVLESDYEDG
jgi:hypothetical protein